MFSERATKKKSTLQAVHNSTQSQRKTGHRAHVLEDNRLGVVQNNANKTGLPDNVKTGMETISGMSLDHVKVHYNSVKPAAVQAHAYAQGSDIYLGPGQEKHLAHELGHVVQQAQGRVAPTTSVAGMAVNDNPALEHEADVMGAKALQLRSHKTNAYEVPIQHALTSPQTGTHNQVSSYESQIAQFALTEDEKSMLELSHPLIQLQKTNACWFLSVLSGLHGQNWVRDLFETGAITIGKNEAGQVTWNSEGVSGAVTPSAMSRHRPVWQQIIESKISKTIQDAPFLNAVTDEVTAEMFQQRMKAKGLGIDLKDSVNMLLQAIHKGLSVNNIRSSPPITAFTGTGAVRGKPEPDQSGKSISIFTAEKKGHAMAVEDTFESKERKTFMVYNQQVKDNPRARYSSEGKAADNSPGWAVTLNYLNRYDITRQPELVPHPSEVQQDIPSLESIAINGDKSEGKKDEEVPESKDFAVSSSTPVQLTHSSIQQPVVQRITREQFDQFPKDRRLEIWAFAKAARNVKTSTEFDKWLNSFKTEEALNKIMAKGIQKKEEETVPPVTDINQANTQIIFIKKLQNQLKDMLELILDKVDQARKSNDIEVLHFVDLKTNQWLPRAGGSFTFDSISPILSTLSTNIERVSISFLDAIEGGIANAEARNLRVGTRFPGVAGMKSPDAKQAMGYATITFARYSKIKSQKTFKQLLPRAEEEFNHFEPSRIWTLLHESTHAILGTSDVKKMPQGAVYSERVAELSPKDLVKQKMGDEYKNADSWTTLIFQLYHFLRSHTKKMEKTEAGEEKETHSDKIAE